MSIPVATGVTSLLTSAVHPLTGGGADYDPLLRAIGDARFVLLGESTHGTHEFVRARAEITRRLIREKGFHGVAVDADGQDAWRADQWARGTSHDVDASDALADFRRFPSWTFRNADVLAFLVWLRSHNAAILEDRDKAGFFGLDVYGLDSSMMTVIAALQAADDDEARLAEARHACFDRFGGDAQGYRASAPFAHGIPCPDEAIPHLVDRLRRLAESALLPADVSARLVDGAAAYYRGLFGSPVVPWGLRDRHMSEMLDALEARLSREARAPAKLVVWAHGSHLGDARATEMGEQGEPSLGQLVRSRHGAGAVLVGFTTDSGTVTASSVWEGLARRRRLRPALEGSYEGLFHTVRSPRFLLNLHENRETELFLSERRLERAIGAVYRPESERRSHYFAARLPEQFDAVVHFDQTRAVEPLECTSLWMRGEPIEDGLPES